MPRAGAALSVMALISDRLPARLFFSGGAVLRWGRGGHCCHRDSLVAPAPDSKAS